MRQELNIYSMPKRLEEPKFWVEHIPFAFYIVSQLKPQIIVELGTHSGNSFFAFCQAAAENNLTTKCYAIDTWLGDKYTGLFEEEIYQNVLHYQQENYPAAALLRMTFDEGLSHFENGIIDILHIDGLHTYEAVKHDFENWLPKLSNNAVVLFHDTQVQMQDFGIWKYWAEISKQYPSYEFKHGYGLGVLIVEKKTPAEIMESIKNGNNYSDIFEKQGKEVYKEYKRRKLKADLKRLIAPHKIIAKRLKK